MKVWSDPLEHMKTGGTIAQIPAKKDSTQYPAATPSSSQEENDSNSILISISNQQRHAIPLLYQMPYNYSNSDSTIPQQNPIPNYENRPMYQQVHQYPNHNYQLHGDIPAENQRYGYSAQHTPNGYQWQGKVQGQQPQIVGQQMYPSQPIVSSPTNNYRKTTLKLVILGNSGVGKTSLMNRFHSNKYTGQYKATIGADFLSKTIQIDDCSVTLTIWDTAGQERFQSLGKAFYRGSDACILVYDVQDFQSLEGLRKWKEDFEDCLISSEGSSVGKSGGGFHQQSIPKIKFVVVGNKSDKDEEFKAVMANDGQRFSDEIGGSFFECSAKTGMNVNDVFMVAARAGLEYNRNKNDGLGIPGYNYGHQNADGRPRVSMRGYIPPRRTVDLNRSSSSKIGNDDCC